MALIGVGFYSSCLPDIVGFHRYVLGQPTVTTLRLSTYSTCPRNLFKKS